VIGRLLCLWRQRASRWRRDQLATRQVAYALAISLVVGALFALAQLVQDYLQERERIEAAGQGVLDLIRAPAARAAFTLDPELGATVVQAAVDVPFVVRAEIADNLGRQLAGADRERPSLPLRWLTDQLFGAQPCYSVSIDRHGTRLAEGEISSRSVGSLEIEFDTRILAQSFLARSWLLLLTGIARTMVLGLVLAIVTHLMITRPLAQMVDAVEAVDPEVPEHAPFRLGKAHEHDELGRLFSTLDRLMGRFRKVLAQRHEAFERLKASEARYRAVVETQTEFIQRMTPDGRLSFVSDAYCRYYGHPREKLLGHYHNAFTLTMTEDRERDRAHLATLTRESPSRTIELRRRLPDGGIRWVQWADTALFDAQGRLTEIQSVGRDVTERVAAEARFLAAAETLPDGLAIFDADDRLIYHNSRYPEHQTPNLRAALALGKRFEDWLRDGAALGPIYHPGMGEGFLEQRLAMRRAGQGDHEQHLADGRWVRIREARMPDGGRVLLSSDITRQRSLEAELRQAEKLKAVGTLASGIAHDFNNILATIYASTEVALLHLPDHSPATAALDRVLSAGSRARHLIADILTFSRSERTPRAAIDFGVAVASALEFCRHTLAPSIDLRSDLPAVPFFVAADESQIHQIVSNLCLNAAQAMPDGGGISVRVESDQGRQGQLWAKLRIADTGAGMDAETAARAFEPFFTTRPVGEGTGLGLAVVHGTVQALGGRIRLRTAPGRGSVFAISLPRIARDSEAQLSSVEGVPAGQGQTAFLVEPDTEAAGAVAETLRNAGYRVMLHARATAALEAFERSRHARLLVAALSPGGTPSGIDLASAMREIAPRLGVVLLASAASTPAEIAAAEGMTATVITKPVLRRELAAAICAQLARSREMPPFGATA
jgi:two-component system, cell cycle sensor histidine kinase and response regulator CckA